MFSENALRSVISVSVQWYNIGATGTLQNWLSDQENVGKDAISLHNIITVVTCFQRLE